MVDERQIYDLRMKKEGKTNTRENVILKGLVEFLCALEQEDFLQSQYESFSYPKRRNRGIHGEERMPISLLKTIEE